jgi:hypothetical protein
MGNGAESGDGVGTDVAGFDVFGGRIVLVVYEDEYLVPARAGDGIELTNPTFPPAAGGTNMRHPAHLALRI